MLELAHSADRLDSPTSQSKDCSPSLHEPIAIIGIGCRLPGGVTNLQQYWELLCNGVDAIEEVPPDRWDTFKFYDKEPGRLGKIITKWGGFLKEIDQFDPGFFGITPREAASMDPQQRLVLETAWEALEDAGQQSTELAGTKVGVFVGVSTFDYSLLQASYSDVRGAGPYTNTGQALSICANRLSFVMNWKGPSYIVDTACSSSLLACHLAVKSIRNRESSMAVVSGVNFVCSPSTYVGFTAMGMLSPDGRCHAFDDAANGFVRSEGCCTMVLKPLSAALRDGDPIHALIAGSACNQDGHTPGMTMPSQSSQEVLVRDACNDAGITPSQVRYVEAHGTGTPVGDPIEINALGTALGENRNGNPCLVGSVKANIGHLEAGSGMAGLVKAALVLKHNQIPPNILINKLNPNIDFESLGLKVPQEMTPLPDGDGPAYSGVNSFGFGGTNVHVILQQFDRSAGCQPASDIDRNGGVVEKSDRRMDEQADGQPRACLIPVSAQSPESVRAMVRSYRDALDENGMWAGDSFEDIVHTISRRRSHLAFRTTLIAKDKHELKSRLQELCDDIDSCNPVFGGPAEPPLVFVFSGQGPQWWGMGRELFQDEPIFHEIIEKADVIIRRLGNWSLIEELNRCESTTRINETSFAQPAIFATQVALFELFKSWGVQPQVVIGHSVGEIGAAYAAGILSFEDAVKVIFHRGRTMGVVKDAGAMVAVSLSAEKIQPYLARWGDKVCLAAVNGPSTITLSGDEALIDQIEQEMKEENIFARRLQVNYAFHSHQMDPVRSDLMDALAEIKPQASRIPMISTVTGQAVEGTELDGEYWWKNVRQPVQFLSGIKRLIEDQHSHFLEISPHPVLAGSIGECYSGLGKQARVVTTLRRGEPERNQLLKSLGQLYALHVCVDWAGLSKKGKFIGLPVYPWYKQSYWTESEDSKVFRLPCEGHPILGTRLPGSRVVFQGFMDTRAQTFALDHKIQGHVLMPGTGFLEIAMALGREVHGDGKCVVTEVELLKPAFMPEGQTLFMQTFVDQKTGKFSIESQPLGQPDRPWTQHCVGTLRERSPVAPELRPTLADARKNCTNPILPKSFYDFFRHCGFDFGKSFQGLTQVRLGSGEMLGLVEIPPECSETMDKYLFHPAVLDACLQGNIGCFMTFNRRLGTLKEMGDDNRKTEIFMPSGYEEVRLYRKPTQRMWTYIRMNERLKDQSHSDVFIFDDEGELIAEVRGFRETMVGTIEGNSDPTSGLLYENEWRLQNRSGRPHKRFVLPNLNTLPDVWSGIESEAALSLASLNRESELSGKLVSICNSINSNSNSEQHGQAIIEEKLRQLFWEYPEFYPRLMSVVRWFHHQQNVRNEADSELDEAERELTELLAATSPATRLQTDFVSSILKNAFSFVSPGRKVRILELKGCSSGLRTSVRSSLPSESIEYVIGIESESGDEESESFESAAESPTSDAARRVVLKEGRLQVEGNEDSRFELILLNVHPEHAVEDGSPEYLRALYQGLSPGGVVMLVPGIWQADSNVDAFAGADRSNAAASNGEGTREDRWFANLKEAGFAVVRNIQSHSAFNKFVPSLILAQRSHEEVARDLVNLNEPSATSDADAEKNGAQDVVDSTSDIDATEDAQKTKKTYLVFKDTLSLGEDLTKHLSCSAEQICFVTPGDTFEKRDQQNFAISASKEDLIKLLKGLSDRRPETVLFLWSLQSGSSTHHPLSFEAIQANTIVVPVLFCQAWTEVFGVAPTNLWLVTEGAQSIPGDDHRIAIEQVSLWGTGRVIRNEFPHLNCRLVDLNTRDHEEIESLVAELEQETIDVGLEDEIAFRGEARYVHRLLGSSLNKFADLGEEPGQPYRLHISDFGTLDGMRMRPAENRDQIDFPTMVEVEVHAAALNFSDVMKALALYPGLPEGFVPVGIECAGVITRVGSEVKNFQVGDEVVCIAPMSLASHAYTDHRFVARKPQHLSMAAAATLPIAFLTAEYALNYIGRMESKEKVLINAATGGVGLAAIQLAQQVEAEVFATAGTAEKRQLLKFLGIASVMNSRTLAFADEIMEKTNKRGVDLILNSLANEAIGKGMSILADYGRFLEIGKRDIYANTPLGLQAFRKNVTFSAIDLDRGLREKPDLCSRIFKQIIADVDARKLAPLPHRVFSVTELIDAFRYMAKAKHIGKVVIDMQSSSIRPARDPATSTVRFRSDATYLLTGGLGGLGASLAPWMVENGARCLVLASRRGVSTEEGEAIVRSMEKLGAKVVIEKVDVSQADQVKSLVEKIERDLPPLRGIMHAAVVLDDGLILQMNKERIEKVCAPKMDAAWYLHDATINLDLDFFVSHSSTSSTLGNVGQVNYAAANAFLDGLAAYRRSIGLPALTVNWGYLGDVGVAAGNKKLADHFELQGVRPVSPSEVLMTLGKLMAFDVNQMGVMRVDWNRLRKAAVTMAKSPRFSQLMAPSERESSDARSGNDIRNLVLATEPEGRLELMLGIVREKVARVLGTKTDQVETQRSLMDLGLDSLMGFELRNWIESELKISVPVVELMQGPTVEKLSGLILAQLEKGDDSSAGQGAQESSADHFNSQLLMLSADSEKSSAVSRLLMVADDLMSDLHGAKEQPNLQAELDAYTVRLQTTFAQSSLLSNADLPPVTNILMTGATGFLGAYLLHDLLTESSEVNVYCLVRAQSEAEGLDRIKQNLNKYQLWKPALGRRIHVVAGDVTLPQYGLADEDYESLSNRIDSVLHNAAGVNFIRSFSQLSPVNIGGTWNSLQFAVTGKVKRYHHVSTLFVFSILDHLEHGVIRETHKPGQPQFLYLGYLQSKWVADSMAQVARQNGLPVTIYRPGIITGDSRTGICGDDVISRSIASAIQLGCSPSGHTRFSFTPVDFVGKGIATLMLDSSSVNQNYHLVNPDQIEWPTMVDWFAQMGHDVAPIPYEDWLKKLKENSNEETTTLLSGMLPLLPDIDRGEPDDEQVEVGGFDNQATINALAKRGIQCPETDFESVRTCVDYLIRSGGIKVPAV